MLTTDFRETYESLPEAVKSAILALSVLTERIGSLPKADRDDLFDLLQAWRNAHDPEEQQNIRRAMEEILAQIPLRVQAFPLNGEKPLSGSAEKWARHVGQQIRELRAKARLTQSQLAIKAHLQQSHISRIESAEVSATNKTLEKIAEALDVAVGEIDPCSE